MKIEFEVSDEVAAALESLLPIEKSFLLATVQDGLPFDFSYNLEQWYEEEIKTATVPDFAKIKRMSEAARKLTKEGEAIRALTASD